MASLQTCVHEIGHAAAALLLGLEPRGVVVFPESGGVCSTALETVEQAPQMEDYTPEKLDPEFTGITFPDGLRKSTFSAAGYVAVRLVLDPETPEPAEIMTGDAAIIDAISRALMPTGGDALASLAFRELAAARARVLLKPILWRIRLAAKLLHAQPGATKKMTAEQVTAALYPESQIKR